MAICIYSRSCAVLCRDMGRRRKDEPAQRAQGRQHQRNRDVGTRSEHKALCHLLLACVTLCHLMRSCAALCHLVPSCALLCRLVPCAILCHLVRSCATLCWLVPSCAVLCALVPPCAILCQLVPTCASLCHLVLTYATLPAESTLANALETQASGTRNAAQGRTHPTGTRTDLPTQHKAAEGFLVKPMWATG